MINLVRGNGSPKIQSELRKIKIIIRNANLSGLNSRMTMLNSQQSNALEYFYK